jgi:hypothetical protein
MIAGEIDELAGTVEVHRALPPESASFSALPALRLADGSPILMYEQPPLADAVSDHAQADRTQGAPRSPGMVVYLAMAMDLGWTDLPGRPLMVPLFQEVVRQGLSMIHAGADLRAGDRFPAPPEAEAVEGWITPAGRRVPVAGIDTTGAVLTEPGFYSAVNRDDQPVAIVAVNIDHAAARTDVQRRADVNAWLQRSGTWQALDQEDLVTTALVATPAPSLAVPLLVIVLALLVVETVAAQRFSRARQSLDVTRAASLRPTTTERERPASLVGGQP